MKTGMVNRITAIRASARAMANLRRPYHRFVYKPLHDGRTLVVDSISGASWVMEKKEEQQEGKE
jgi:hypothetical protein